jgi:hypothetical protein
MFVQGEGCQGVQISSKSKSFRRLKRIAEGKRSLSLGQVKRLLIGRFTLTATRVLKAVRGFPGASFHHPRSDAIRYLAIYRFSM